MMYTILIWGLLFTYMSEQMLNNLTCTAWGEAANSYLVINDMLILVTIIRLGYILWGQRARWSSVEWYHIGLLLSSVALGAFAAWRKLGDRYVEDPVTAIAIYFAISFGWMVVRPALFSYGLLRYRLLGTNIRAERALAVIAGALFSTIIFFGIMAASGNAATGDMLEWDQASMGAALVVSLIVFFPAWMASERFATRLLPVSAGAATVSMREKRNIYLMALQTATVAGRIDDDDDAEAVYNLRRELGVTDREHDLLVETIAVHEESRHSRNDVEQAYLITKDGRLVAYYEPGLAGPSAMEEVDNKDVVAGMLTAVKDFVGEAMKEESGGGVGPRTEGEGAEPSDAPLRSSMEAISYGTSTLLIEMDNELVLAMVLNGQDDPSIRQAMRDTLAEVNETYLRISGEKWDGDRRGLEGIWSLLQKMAEHIGTAQT